MVRAIAATNESTSKPATFNWPFARARTHGKSRLFTVTRADSLAPDIAATRDVATVLAEGLHNALDTDCRVQVRTLPTRRHGGSFSYCCVMDIGSGANAANVQGMSCSLGFDVLMGNSRKRIDDKNYTYIAFTRTPGVDV